MMTNSAAVAMVLAVGSMVAGCGGEAGAGPVDAGTFSCAFTVAAPFNDVGVAQCHSEDGRVTIRGANFDVDLLLTPSTQPPSMAFAVTAIHAPMPTCSLARGSWVTDDGSQIHAYLNCSRLGDPGVDTLEFTVAATSF